MILFLFLLSIYRVRSHVPTFGECRIENTISKSWAVYTNVEDSFSCLLNVPKNEDISFSISLPANYNDPYDIDITLFGHGAIETVCDPYFSGWGKEKPAWRKLDSSLDSTKIIPTQNVTELVFEPFGVGGYREIASCQGKATIGDEFFNLTIHNRGKTIPISIGVGMAESFTVWEVFFMSFSIANTWNWAGSKFYIMTLVLSILLYIIISFKKDFIWTNILSHVIVCSLITNSVQFFCQIMYLYFIHVPVFDNWLFPLIVHVTLPLIMCVLYLYINKKLTQKWHSWIFWILFLLYTASALWQAYCVAFFAVVIKIVQNWINYRRSK